MELRKFIATTIREYLNEQQKIGKKVIAYHGTPHGKFDKFSMRKRGSGADLTGLGDYGKGFYFSPNKEYALSYATEVQNRRSDIKEVKPMLYTVKLKMDRPFDMRILSEIQKRSLTLMKKYGVFNIPDSEYENMYNELGITEEEHEFYNDVENLIGDNWGDWDIKNKLKERGYDSLINYDGNEYVVYSPNQIEIIDVQEINK
jgi:hypothetical protein